MFAPKLMPDTYKASNSSQQPALTSAERMPSRDPSPRTIIGAHRHECQAPVPPLDTAICTSSPTRAVSLAQTIGGERIRLRSLSDILARPTHTRWLLEGIIERGVIAIAAGPRGTYKSFLGLDWAMRIALNGETVVAISAEGEGLDRRLLAWLKTYARDVSPETLPFYAIEHRVDLNDDITSLVSAIDKCGIRPTFILVDTLSKNCGTLDTDSNKDVKAFIGQIDAQLRRRYDATVLLIGHTGHRETGRARGASSLGQDTEAEYIIRRHGNFVSVSRQRFKDSQELPDLTYRAEVVELGYLGEDCQPVTSLIMRQAEPASAHNARLQPKGQVNRIVYDAIRECQNGQRERVDEDMVLELAISRMPRPQSTRDTRRQHALRSLAQLARQGFIEREGNACWIT